MPIVRVQKRRRFTVIDNEILENTTLSWKAKGLLSYLLSKPNDWTVILEHLCTQASDGMTSLRSGIDELIKEGYIIRERERLESGSYGGIEYTVYETPQMT
jgi:hypothetical protein